MQAGAKGKVDRARSWLRQCALVWMPCRLLPFYVTCIH